MFVGKNKESLDRVDWSELVIADVISIFGPFVKFNTTEKVYAHRAIYCVPVLARALQSCVI